MTEPRHRSSSTSNASLLVRRGRAWALGRGLFSVHVGAYLLGATGLVLLNLLRSPTDLWFWDVLRGWGVLLALHAVVVAALAAARGLTAGADERPATASAAPAGAAYPSAPANGRARPSTGAAFDPTALTRPVGVVAMATRGVATAVTAEGRRAHGRWRASRPAGSVADGAYAGWGRPLEPSAPSFQSRVGHRFGPLDRLSRRVVAWTTSLASSFGWTARPRTRPSSNVHPAPFGRFVAPTPVTEPSPMPAVTAAALHREEPTAEPAARAPLPVPTLFLLRREESSAAEPAATWPRADTTVPGRHAPGGPPTGEDIVLAGPSPLDAADPNLDWTWMEAAAAAWLAQREADVPGAAQSARPADHDANVAPTPSDQRAGAD